MLNGPYTREYKGQSLNFFLETHATPHSIQFIRLRILPRNLVVNYTGVWMTLKRIGFLLQRFTSVFFSILLTHEGSHIGRSTGISNPA